MSLVGTDIYINLVSTIGDDFEVCELEVDGQFKVASVREVLKVVDNPILMLI